MKKGFNINFNEVDNDIAKHLEHIVPIESIHPKKFEELPNLEELKKEFRLSYKGKQLVFPAKK